MQEKTTSERSAGHKLALLYIYDYLMTKTDEDHPVNAAGLRRIGLGDRISRYFSADEIIPSSGQGILGLQGRAGEDYSCLDAFVSLRSAVESAAERAFVGALGGGCSSPIAAHAEYRGDILRLRGFYYDETTGTKIRRTLTAELPPEDGGLREMIDQSRRLGKKLAAGMTEGL